MLILQLGTGKYRRGPFKATESKRNFNALFPRSIVSEGMDSRLHYELNESPVPAGPIEQADA